MQTGMVKVKGDTYYLGDDGVRQTGWVELSSRTGISSTINNGIMQVGWIYLEVETRTTPTTKASCKPVC